MGVRLKYFWSDAGSAQSGFADSPVYRKMCTDMFFPSVPTPWHKSHSRSLVESVMLVKMPRCKRPPLRRQSGEDLILFCELAGARLTRHMNDLSTFGVSVQMASLSRKSVVGAWRFTPRRQEVRKGRGLAACS